MLCPEAILHIWDDIVAAGVFLYLANISFSMILLSSLSKIIAESGGFSGYLIDITLSTIHGLRKYACTSI